MPTELSVLTSMITPAVLISACAGLILSTSVRLGRVVDRVRALAERFEEMATHRPDEAKTWAGKQIAALERNLQRLLTSPAPEPLITLQAVATLAPVTFILSPLLTGGKVFAK